MPVIIDSSGQTKIIDGGTGGGGGSGTVLQTVSTTYTTYSSSTATFPLDDTIPQNTEGTEIMTLAITPASASNLLVITAVLGSGYINAGASQNLVIMALFQDSTANALASTFHISHGTASPILHNMTAGTTSSTTFKIRVGLNVANSLYLNGYDVAALYGGVNKAELMIQEIEV